MWDTIEAHWRVPNKDLGDWSHMIDQFKPYRDDILAQAAARYAQRWGSDKISTLEINERIIMIFLNELNEWVQAFVNILPGRIGVWFRRWFYSMRLANIGKAFTVMSGAKIIGVKAIKVGDDFVAGERFQLYAAGNGAVIIGNRVALNTNVMINADLGGRITVGDNVIIGPNTVLRASNHVFKERNKFIRDQGHESGVIVIGDDVWLGANVVILPNVHIGQGAIVGAGAVVTKDVGAFMIVGGVPAQVIGHR